MEHSLPLDSSGGWALANGTAATDEAVGAVLAAPARLLIRGGFYAGRESSYLSHVTIRRPPPPALPPPEKVLPAACAAVCWSPCVLPRRAPRALPRRVGRHMTARAPRGPGGGAVAAGISVTRRRSDAPRGGGFAGGWGGGDGIGAGWRRRDRG
jgi:hypothetical protein